METMLPQYLLEKNNHIEFSQYTDLRMEDKRQYWTKDI